VSKTAPEKNSTGVRIAVVATHYAEYSLRLAKAFGSEHKTLLISSKESVAREVTPSMLSETPGRLTIKTFNNGRRFKSLYFLANVLREVVLFRPNVIIAHEMGDWNHTLAILLLSRIFRVALVVHDPRPHMGDDTAVRSLVKGKIAAERRAASALIVHGEYCADQLRRELSVNQTPVIMVVNHGPILGDVGDAAQEASDILLFGRMQAYKGIAVLRRALEILAERGLHPKTTLAGRGPALEQERSGLVRLANVEIREGFLGPEQAGGLLRAARIVVLPYLEATQSGVVAAAFAAGRPVVATSVGSIPEVVESGLNGLLVAPGDPGALADALHRILSAPGLEAALAEGARATSMRMSWASIASEIRRGVLQG
jgi:glycosyltransferase involved in cell wall biosynthesis